MGGGLGILSAAVLLAGEMAGSGVLALPDAMIGTGGRNISSQAGRIRNIKC